MVFVMIASFYVIANLPVFSQTCEVVACQRRVLQSGRLPGSVLKKLVRADIRASQPRQLRQTGSTDTVPVGTLAVEDLPMTYRLRHHVRLPHRPGSSRLFIWYFRTFLLRHASQLWRPHLDNL
jgi:hypothetical protein